MHEFHVSPGWFILVVECWSSW